MQINQTNGTSPQAMPNTISVAKCLFLTLGHQGNLICLGQRGLVTFILLLL